MDRPMGRSRFFQDHPGRSFEANRWADEPPGGIKPSPGPKGPPSPNAGRGCELPANPDISVGESLVPSHVSENQFGVITTGGHKTLPYDVLVCFTREATPNSTASG